ncbi:MAG: DUF3108 domain-containing protein [Cytophagales bacterium]|nr:DUF3108 domain-containing protein [Cytophagales bacterium]
MVWRTRGWFLENHLIRYLGLGLIGVLGLLLMSLDSISWRSVSDIIRGGGMRRVGNLTQNLVSSSLERGESIVYSASYGLISAGWARAYIDPDAVSVQGHPCYHIRMEIKTIGALRFLYKVDHVWATYYDTVLFIPHRFYRFMEENSYKKYEVNYFHQQGGRVEVAYLGGPDTTQVLRRHNYPLSQPVQDALSASYYLRTMDTHSLKQGDSFILPIFEEDSTYSVNIRYLGRELVKTIWGPYTRTLVFSPIMPKNRLLVGPNPLKIWVSESDPRAIVKVKMDTFLGALDIKMTEYEKH